MFFLKAMAILMAWAGVKRKKLQLTSWKPRVVVRKKSGP